MLLSLLLSLFFTTVEAQTYTPIPSQYSDVIQQQVEVAIDPDTPTPNSSVTVTLSAYGTDLNAATINWTLNGKSVQGGIGDKTYTLTTGNAGQTSKLVANIIPTDGLPITKTISITPENLDLLWQAQSYTPPFYQGKALFPPQGTLTLVAMPGFVSSGGTQISAKNLIYKWTKDDTVLGSLSGYGKNTLTLTGSVISKPMLIEVDAQSQDGSLKASREIEVAPSDVQALLYPTDPLYGTLFNKSISSFFNLNGKEISFEAFPYYFSGYSRSNSSLSYTWQMNSTQINVPSTQDNMTFRNDGNSTGNSTVALAISEIDKILQNTSTNFTINFGQPAKNFFGL